MKPWKLFNIGKGKGATTPPAPKPFKSRTYITRARRLDWDAATETWENWTDRDILVGAVGADAVTLSQVHVSGSYNPNLVKAKPFAGQRERFAVEDAIDAGKTEVVATPETHPGFAIGECPDAAPHGHGRAWGGPQQSFAEVIRITEMDEAGDPEHYYYMICKGYGGGYTYGQQTIGQSGWNGYESYGWGDNNTTVRETKNGLPLWDDLAGPNDPDTLDDPCHVCQQQINDCRCTVEDLNDVGICWICNGNFLVSIDNPKACRCPASEMADLSIGIDYMRTPGVPVSDGHKPTGTKGLSDEDLLLIGWDLIADGEIDPCDNEQGVIEAARQWMRGES